MNLVEKLIEAKRQYYINGTSFLTDSQFDTLEDELRKVDPNNKYFSIVGVNIKGSNNIKHNHPLLSCAKGKKPEEAFRWLEKIGYSGLLIAMPKVDGLTGCVTYVDGKFSHMSTRGDGQIGQDISHLASYLNLPQEIPYSGIIDVVGEIHLPKNTELETNGKPLRNIAAGLVNRKELSDDLKYLRFVAYNMLGQDNLYYFEERLDRLDLFGFETVERFSLKNGLDIEFFYEKCVKEIRDTWRFEVDGIVLQVNELNRLDDIDALYNVNHHHHYNFALKFLSFGCKTKLIDIIWDVSKNGNVIPTALFEPVYILDRLIQRASLSNCETIERMKLEKHDEIYVILSNDVIPYVVENITKGIKQ